MDQVFHDVLNARKKELSQMIDRLRIDISKKHNEVAYYLNCMHENRYAIGVLSHRLDLLQHELLWLSSLLPAPQGEGETA